MSRRVFSSRRCRSSRSYWGTDYDWKKAEAKINAVPHFITNIDGLDIHFIHVKSKEKNAMPMIITHGWPGSFIEQMKVIAPLTESHGVRRKGRGRIRCRDPFAAGLRIFRQADGDRLATRPHRHRVDDADAEARLQEVRGAGRRLGERRLGGDGAAGAAGAARHFHQHGGDRSARDQQGRSRRAAKPPSTLSADERNAWEQLAVFYLTGLGYAKEMSLKPQTLYAIADSPVGLAAWILDHDARSYRLISARLRRTARKA